MTDVDPQEDTSAMPAPSAVPPAPPTGGAALPGVSAGELPPTFVRADSFGRRLILATVLPLGLMTCIATLLAWNARAQSESIAGTTRAANLVSDTRTLATQFRDLDQCLRDYLASANPDSLAQFQKNEPAVQQGFASLRQYPDPDLTQAQRDESAKAYAAYRNWSDYARSLLARRAGGQDTSSPKFALQSFSFADGVRKQLGAFITAEDAQRMERSNNAHRTTRSVLFATLGLALVSGLVLALFTVRQLTGLSRNYRGALDVLRREGAERARADAERRDLLLREQRARADAEVANRRKDQFLAVLSHELRTPLTPVLARVMLLKRDPSLSPEIHQALDMIRRNVELEARLIDDLLDSTRLAAGKIKLNTQTIDAVQRLMEVADGFAEQLAAKQLQLKVELAATHTTVRADPVRLQQIFWNLISNAVKYTPAGGTITLHSRGAAPPASATNLPSDRVASVVIEISDTGVGIDEQTLGRLFKPFEQGEQTLNRRFGGLGLGLSISRSLLEMQGGTLTAASPGPGKGATFTVTLPFASPQPAIAPQPKPHWQTILLVEDNEDTLRVLARLLRHSGYTVKTAATVSAALAMVDDEFDLLISDIGLPDGNGWELMRVLKSRHPVPGIALSGFAQQEDVERSRSVGFARHLAKPINPQELEAAIEQVTAELAA